MAARQLFFPLAKYVPTRAELSSLKLCRVQPDLSKERKAAKITRAGDCVALRNMDMYSDYWSWVNLVLSSLIVDFYDINVKITVLP